MTQHTVYISELQHGHACFDSREEAEAFVEGKDRNWDLVKWTNAEITELTVESSD
jgi:hypothetical protein|tara:strand:+ start:132 stop:296 length:165 start_codon:yes stop_codon:yes gene_type:complete